MEFIKSIEIKNTLLKVDKPTAFSNKPFDLNQLDDRAFEILLYQIYKNKIGIESTNYDKIHLMQGVGERGRDCLMQQNNEYTGVIQCKKYKKNIDKGTLLDELIKFILHYIKDNTLIHDINNFNYYIATSTGFSETSILLISSLKNLSEIKLKGDIKNRSEKIIKRNKHLNDIIIDEIEDKIYETISAIKIIFINPSDIVDDLNKYNHIISQFFKVLTVTDNSLLENIINNYLEPLLSEIFKGKAKKDKDDFQLRFTEYLNRAYNTYSSSQTLVFGNQQKKLKEFYYPLNLIANKFGDSDSGFLKYRIEDFNDELIPHYKKVLIVDNGGMGKSTIMKILFLSSIELNKGIPIFIELRKLNKNKSIIDEILNKLSPINYDIERNTLTELIDKGNFIFFFDGYDEISPDNKTYVTYDLENFIYKASKNLFILTSRPDISLNTFSEFQEFKIMELENEDAFELIHKIGNNNEKSKKLVNTLRSNEIKKINEFLKSPLLVSLLYKKFEHRENIPNNLQEFYFEVFQALFGDHDLSKGDSYVRHKNTEISFTHLFRILRHFAYETYLDGETTYSNASFCKQLEKVQDQIQERKINVEKLMEDLTFNIPLFKKDGYNYNWSHKSFQEYFVAEYICRDSKQEQITILKKMYNSKNINKYKFIFELCYLIDYKEFKKAVIIPYIEEFINFYENIDINENEHLIQLRTLLYNQKYIFFHIDENLSIVNSFLNSRDTFLEKYQNIINDEYELLCMHFSGLVSASVIKRKDISELLLKNDENIFKNIEINNNYIQHENIEHFLKDNDYVIDPSTDIHFHDIELLLAEISLTSYRKKILDINKCKKYIDDYEKSSIKHTSSIDKI